METPTLISTAQPSTPVASVVVPASVQIGGPSIIQISTLAAFISVASVLIGIGIAWGKLHKQGSRIEDTLDKEVRPDLKDVRERFVAVETKVETLWQYRFAPTVGATGSPYRPTDIGNTLLTGSKLKDIIDDSWPNIEAEIQKEAVGGKDTPLDIEKIALRYLERMVEGEGYKTVRIYASNHPENGLSVILLVGSWYIRGRYLKEDWVTAANALPKPNQG